MALPRGIAPLRRPLRLLETVERSYAATPSRLTTPLTRPFTLPTPSSVYSPRCAARSFTSSPCLHRKRKIVDPSRLEDAAAAAETASPEAAPIKDSGGRLDPENPLDMGPVKAAYTPIDAHFQAKLQTLVAGGRFNPTSIGALPVTIKAEPPSASATASSSSSATSAASDSSAHESFPLRELAQVVPRGGRTISLLVNEKSYIKPIMSAVQASREFNQQPQHAEGNDLELLLRVEPEPPGEAVRRVRELGRAWRERVRGARTRHEKVLKEWKKTGAVLPDAVHKAEKELQKVQDRKLKDIDEDEARAVKQLERNKA